MPVIMCTVYALRPVLQSLGAKSILPGIYATDAQVTLTPEATGNRMEAGTESRRKRRVVEGGGAEGAVGAEAALLALLEDASTGMGMRGWLAEKGRG